MAAEHKTTRESTRAMARTEEDEREQEYENGSEQDTEDVEESELKNYSVILKNRVLKEAAELKRRQLDQMVEGLKQQRARGDERVASMIEQSKIGPLSGFTGELRSPGAISIGICGWILESGRHFY